MALRPPAKPTTAAEAEAIERVIAGGSQTLADRRQRDDAPSGPAPQAKEVSFTMTIPPGLAQVIDRHRAPTKTSRRSWLLQAAEEKLKREGLI